MSESTLQKIKRNKFNPEIIAGAMAQMMGQLSTTISDIQQNGTDGQPPAWGQIQGDLPDQSDLQEALDGKIVFGVRDVRMDLDQDGDLPNGIRLYFPYGTQVTGLRALVFYSGDSHDIAFSTADGPITGGVLELRDGGTTIEPGTVVTATPTANNTIDAGSYLQIEVDHLGGDSGGSVLVSIEFKALQTEVEI